MNILTDKRPALNDIKKKMIENDGVPPDIAARCVYYEESSQESVGKQKLKLCTNYKKTGKLWDIPTMEAAGMIISAEIDGIKSAHGGLLPPYYFVTGLRRVVDDRVKPHREYLTYNWIFEGIRVGELEGQLKGEDNFRINESGTRGYHIEPVTGSNVVKGKDGQDIKVTTFNQDTTRRIDNVDHRIWDIPFSKEVVEALLKYTKDGKVSLGITQVSTGKNYGVKTMEEFLTEDVLALIQSFESPKPAIDSKSLLDELERRARERAEKETETHGQYG